MRDIVPVIANAFVAPVTVVEDGDPGAESSWQPTAQELTDRTEYLKLGLGVVDGNGVTTKTLNGFVPFKLSAGIGTANGLEVTGGSTGGVGIAVDSPFGTALYAQGGPGGYPAIEVYGGTDSPAAFLVGQGTSHGVEIQAVGSGAALRIDPVVGSGLGIEILSANGTRCQLRMVPSAQPTGPNQAGDMYMAAGGVLKVCTVAGTPGTFVSVGAQV